MYSDSLRDLLTESVPEKFWKELSSRQKPLYNEAFAFSNSGLWDAPEAKDVHPYIRRAMFESLFRMAARNSGLKSHNMLHAGENCSYVLVRSKQIVLTMHHVASPNYFVDSSVSRRQNSAINSWLDEHTVKQLLLKPLPELRKAGKIYVYVLHGQQLINVERKEYESFLRVGIPNEGMTAYKRIYDVHELLAIYAQRAKQKDITGLRVADRAIPKLKAEGNQ